MSLPSTSPPVITTSQTPTPRRVNSNKFHLGSGGGGLLGGSGTNSSNYNRISEENSEFSDASSSMRQFAGRAAKAPLNWAAHAAEQIASTTANVALTTVAVASKTAGALASTTELAANVVARKTASVALNTASVATQTASLAATKTSQISETAGVAVAATATTVVDGISHLSLNQSPKASGNRNNNNPSRSFRTEAPVPSFPSAQIEKPPQLILDFHQGPSQTPEAFSLGTSTLPLAKQDSADAVSSMRSVSMRLWAMLGATNETARKQWITNVTSSRPTPPSAKYLRKILTMAWETKGESVDEYYRWLAWRPIGTDPFCALKALITSLRLVREGPPEALNISIANVKVIDAIGATWAERVLLVDDDPQVQEKKEDPAMNLHEQLLIARLSALIVQKLHFHDSLKRFSARYEEILPLSSSSTAAMASGDSPPTPQLVLTPPTIITPPPPSILEEDKWEKDFEIASGLLTLLGTIEGVARLALGVGGGQENSPQPAALALASVLTEEASGAFDALSTIMVNLRNETKSSGDSAVVKSLFRRTHEAYEGLRLYFGMAQSFGYIAALKTVPQMSITPPTSQTVLNNRPYTKSAILNALMQEEAVQDRLGRVDSRLAESNDQGGDFDFSSRAVLDPHPEEDETKGGFELDEDDDEEEEEVEEASSEASGKILRAQTTANPFDTGNSSLILLAETHGGGGTFEGISNPFLSGISTFASARPNNNNNNNNNTGRNSNLRRSGSTRNIDATNRALDQCVRSFEFSGIMLSAQDVTVTGEVIGRGAFSVVYRGKLNSNGAEVAVKELQLEEWGRSPEMVLDFRAEVALMKAVHHPNVLQLIGAQTSPSLRLISEFCARGNLLDLLYIDRQAFPTGSKTLSWTLRVRLALGEARGMAFLHTAFPAPLIHRDLKSPNLLLSKQWTLKVSDFGLSRFMGRTGGSGPCGTTQWMAPEVMECKPYDETADVFSFGVNLWELATRRVPWEGQENVKQQVISGKRLDVTSMIEDDCPEILLELMQQCWSSNPAQRPKFPEIVKILKNVQQELE